MKEWKYGSFNIDSYQEVSIDWLTVTLKYDNHGGGQSNVAHPRIIGQKGVHDRLIAYIEPQTGLNRPDDHGEKHELKEFFMTELSKYSNNGLELPVSRRTVTWVFLVDMSGILCEFRAKGLDW